MPSSHGERLEALLAETLSTYPPATARKLLDSVLHRVTAAHRRNLVPPAPEFSDELWKAFVKYMDLPPTELDTWTVEDAKSLVTDLWLGLSSGDRNATWVALCSLLRVMTLASRTGGLRDYYVAK